MFAFPCDMEVSLPKHNLAAGVTIDATARRRQERAEGEDKNEQKVNDEAQPQLSKEQMAKTPCEFFAKGLCVRKNSHCRFLHQQGASSNPAVVRCRPQPLGLGESESDSGSSESTAVPISSGLETWSLPCTPPVMDKQITRSLQTLVDRPASPPPSPAPVAPPGLPLPLQFPSRGSVLHDVGQCRPCAWFWKVGGCQNGRDCGHCHVCLPGEVKARKKAKMIAAKVGVGSLGAATLGEPTTVDVAREQPHLLATMPVQPPPLDLMVLLPKVAPPLLSIAPCLLPDLAPPTSSSQSRAHPPAPPMAPPKLNLTKKIDFPTPPPLKSPDVVLSPGALPRSLALACMDDDASDGRCRPVTVSAHADSSETKIEAHSASSPPTWLSSAPAPPRHRVTLDLDKALLPSIGSALHGVGQCVACAWFWKPQGCQNDAECSYCHLCPQGEIRRRRKLKNAVLRAGSGSNNAIPSQPFEISPLLY